MTYGDCVGLCGMELSKAIDAHLFRVQHWFALRFFDVENKFVWDRANNSYRRSPVARAAPRLFFRVFPGGGPAV